MADRLIEVVAHPSFRAQAGELGAARSVDRITGSIAREIRHGLPRPRRDGMYWFERSVSIGDRGNLGSYRVWVGGALTGDRLELLFISDSPPP